ncbi:hypothetical protein CP532_2254 [Ophiocordyceps camponoti-leonardi (nom. inval.)]|nr:hypothetical protein CP532_2254 [Ophiocordyceps camponoti-leonardi (nom. inval.)]
MESSSASAGLKENMIDVAARLTDGQKTLLYFFSLCWLVVVLGRRFRRSGSGDEVPVFGYRSMLEPSFVLRARFAFGAKSMIRAGCAKMKDQPFVLRRWSNDVLCLPMKYLDELRLKPVSQVNLAAAQASNFVPQWTCLHVLTSSRLHVEVLKQKLNPQLFHFVALANEELDLIWNLEMPKADGKFYPLDILQKLVSPISSRVFLGRATCRDPRWVRLAIDFTIDAFLTACTLNLFPYWSHFIIARLIPARRRVLKHLRVAENTVRRLSQEHAAVKEARDRGEEIGEEEDTLLNWMLDNGSPSECVPSEMGPRQCALTLGSIHTTTLTTLQLLYDLCDHPEWFPVLREEIDSLANELGGPGEKPSVTTREWCNRLEKLDSFLRLLVGQDVNLRDGLRLRSGTIIAFPSCEYQFNPDKYRDSTSFDPMRSYRLRRSSPDQRNNHRAGMTHPTNLTFGYGNQACTGRHFAVAEVKLIVARLLHEYDIEFVPGQSRPRTFHINEISFTNPYAKLMMRRRRRKEVLSC